MKVSKFISLFIIVAAGSFWACSTQTQTRGGGEGISQTAESASDETTLASVAPSGESQAQTTSIQEAEDSNIALIVIADEVMTLDPYYMANTHPDGSIASHLWDTLTLINDELEVKPHLAESWQLINNFTWEFILRKDITFHNGEEVNAEAIRYSIERSQMKGSLETFAQDIGFKEVEIVDNYTVRIVTDQPVTNLPYHLAFLEILPPDYYSETENDQLAIAPVGSGPYRLASWTRDEVILEAIPTYWKGEPVLSHLVFQTVRSDEDRLAALRRGEATLVTNLPLTQVDQWNEPDSKLVANESTQRLFVGMRFSTDSPLADKRVRQALNYGVNVEQIISEKFDGYGEPYGSWVTPPGHNAQLVPWPYDPELARELLIDAGYSEGFTITLKTPVDVYYQDVIVAEAIAQQLGEIGITVDVEAIGYWPTYVQKLLSDDTNYLFLLGLNSHGDVLEDVKIFSNTFAFNPTGWENDNFENILTRAANTFNEIPRIRLLNEAQAIVYDEAPWIWLWRPYRFYGINHNLDWWTPRSDGLIHLYRPITVTTEISE